MKAGDLIDLVREDYLDDVAGQLLWSDGFFLRAIAEAEREVCNRWNLLFDDSTTSIVKIPVIHNVASYSLSPKITKIKQVLVDGVPAIKRHRDTLNRDYPNWRNDLGITTTTPTYTINGLTHIRFWPMAHGSKDAAYIQDTAPSAAADGDFWWDTFNELLYQYDTGIWILTEQGVIANAMLEVYRLPLADSIDKDYAFEIPAQYHEDLAFWVCHRAYKKQDADQFNQERSDYFLGRFEQVFGKAVSLPVRIAQMEGEEVAAIHPVAYTSNTEPDDGEDW